MCDSMLAFGREAVVRLRRRLVLWQRGVLTRGEGRDERDMHRECEQGSEEKGQRGHPQQQRIDLRPGVVGVGGIFFDLSSLSEEFWGAGDISGRPLDDKK